VHHDLAVLELLGRAITRHAGVRFSADAPHTAHVPQLRNDLAAIGMHRIDHLLPTGQRGIAIKMRYVRITVRSFMPNGRALGDDQANTGRGTTTVVFNDFGVRHSAR
jgi:hypothetical protein